MLIASNEIYLDSLQSPRHNICCSSLFYLLPLGVRAV